MPRNKAGYIPASPRVSEKIKGSIPLYNSHVLGLRGSRPSSGVPGASVCVLLISTCVIQMKHCDETSILRHSLKGEGDGGWSSRRGERRSSVRGVARDSGPVVGEMGKRSRTSSCSHQYPFHRHRHRPRRLFLPIPDRERIPRMQTFSSAFPPVWSSYLTVIRRKH